MLEAAFFNNLTSSYEMFFNPAGSCQMDGIISLYNYIMSYLTAILCVVTTALLFIILIHLHGARHLKQFRKEENLNDLINWLRYVHRWTHSTTLELIWTIIPTIILIFIAVPSFILLYSLDEIVDTQSVVKVIGFQWYWKYEYPVLDTSKEDITTFSYLSYMLPFSDLTETKNRRLLEVDAPLVLPTNVNSKLVITAKDVLHSFAVPALGLKMDAVPGWLNQITVHIFKSGMFYGQCSELCGVNHGFMPIVVAAIDFETFEHFLSKCSGVENTISSISTDAPTPDAPTPDAPTPEDPSNSNEMKTCTTGKCFLVNNPNLVFVETRLAFFDSREPKLQEPELTKLIEELNFFDQNRNADEVELIKFLKEIKYNPLLEEHITFFQPFKRQFIEYEIIKLVIYEYLLEANKNNETLVKPTSFLCYVTDYTKNDNADYLGELEIVRYSENLNPLNAFKEAAKGSTSPFHEYKANLQEKTIVGVSLQEDKNN